uniref:Uncharacterized protein n=1 Tax=Acrobeloides nanus TaxID=290746 RepID=A0A914CZ18_9BILA
MSLEATSLIKQNPKQVHLLIVKKADYELESLEALRAKLLKLEEELNKSRNVEQSLAADKQKLEQENEVLRQQVSDLQASQKEYDFMKVEISQLIEDKELVEAENHKFIQFQLLTDLQIEEALSSTKDQDIDKSELLQQNNKLKVLHNIRKEQIAKLRSVLKSNKISPDTALQNLKNKYETEKKIQDETLEKLRRELKQFKLDAETSSSQRTSYTARCEELQAQ